MMETVFSMTNSMFTVTLTMFTCMDARRMKSGML